MKSIEQLKKLADNPFYELTSEEQKRLDVESLKPNFSSLSFGSKKNRLTKGNAAAKETGHVEKHPSDPVAE